MLRIPICCALFLATLSPVKSSNADEPKWTVLFDGHVLTAWSEPHGEWEVVKTVALDSKYPKQFSFSPGAGIMMNGPKGKTNNLLSKEKFGDSEVYVEFMIPQRSNSGVKFQGLYEVQIYDSWGVKNPTASDCGGVYPRAELLPRYHHIDKGTPPRVNASRPAGEWQTLDMIFQAPRFNAEGKKIANARFDKVMLNGQTIHENLELRTPTGHAWQDKEVAEGPILLQADHGPVAFRSVKVRRLPVASK